MTNMKKHKDFMLKALHMAENSGSDVPIAALIVKDGEIIAQATNQKELLNDPTAHAEINAIRAACRILRTFDLSGAILYSTGE